MFEPHPRATQVGAGLDDLLAALGIAPADVQADLDDSVTRVLANRGHRNVAVSGIRNGQLTLIANGPAAVLARTDADELLAAISAVHPETVTEIRVIVGNPATALEHEFGTVAAS